MPGKLRRLTILISVILFFSSFQATAKGKLFKEKITWQGTKRSYLVYLPANYNNNDPVPVLFHLHGGGGTARGTIRLTYGKFNELADEYGFIVVYPNALKRNWNDGRIVNMKPGQEYVDDVGFISEIIETLKNTYQVDPNRIFTTGMSNGGFMSARLLCDRADLFRGGAVLTATLSANYLPKCNPEKPIAVLVMNGTDDPLLPYNGGQVKVLKKSRGEIVSTETFINFWKEQNGCMQLFSTIDLPDTDKNDGTTVTIEEYASCDDEGALKLYRINGGGHTWPGGRQYLFKSIIGYTSREINACEVIWNFFSSLD